MIEIGQEEYLSFFLQAKHVKIGGSRIPLLGPREITTTAPQEGYLQERNTVWSFPERGKWATHDGLYRGNWSPFVPRNLILRYTAPLAQVLDPMMGGGTTLVECRLLQRNAIGVDVNPNAVMLARDKLAFHHLEATGSADPQIRTFVGDARHLDKIDDATIDFIAAHPPYYNIIRYSEGSVEGDLSESADMNAYLAAVREVAMESYRVLKNDSCCAVLIGDTRKYRHYVPISYAVLGEFVRVGFVLLEDIIKIQHNTTSELERWRGDPQHFYKIAHEHLFVLRKPRDDRELRMLELSRPIMASL